MVFKKVLVICVFISTGIFSKKLDKDELDVTLRKNLKRLLETDEEPHDLKKFFGAFQFPHLFRTDSSAQSKSISSFMVCLTCDITLDVALRARRAGLGKHKLQGFVTNTCALFNIETEPVCRGFAEVNIDTVLYIIDNKPDLTSRRICSFILQFMGCVDPGRKNWVIEVPPRPMKYPEENMLQQVSFVPPPSKILHLCDIHYDISYTVGSNAACSEPLCCRPDTTPKRPEDAAGRWGDYRGCDTSLQVITATLDHIASEHKDLDYVYFTGDIVDHKAWGTSIPRNTKVISDVLDHLKTSLGKLKVFPVLGNHETHPINNYSPQDVKQSNVSTQWLFRLVADKWQMWLPAETRETIIKGGYYTVLVKPGFRIIALNSNVGFIANWWLWFDDVDPYGQLKWLVQILTEAELKGEAVHILTHVPSGGDGGCFWNWGREYVRVIKRFSNTIVAQFNGHTHKQDHIILYNSSDLSQPLHIAFNGGSLTPWYNVNPNYIVYHIHPKNYEVLDYESWAYNITEANLTPELVPRWFKVYSFKSAYGVSSLSPHDFSTLLERMTKNHSIAEQYFRFKFRDSDYALREGCDRNCHLRNLCTIVTPYYGYTSQCDILKAMWNSLS